ncbi:MAG TPA: hypothetical protein VNN22_19430 [Verrucomicrobiae bacterium]|nr:hypothetical protein [Verrucomicrobiae bacterium]
MATVISRTFASTPQRTAGETWTAIMKLLAPDAASAARAELQKVAGVAASAIVSEAPANDAIYVYGEGPQIRIYCVFGENAVSQDGLNEDPLIEIPTAGSWKMSLPCLPEDLDWTEKKLKTLSSRITARATGKDVEYEHEKKPRASAEVALNLAEFLKP